MPSMNELQELVKKYNLTRSGSKTQVAKRIYSLRSLYLPEKQLLQQKLSEWLSEFEDDKIN